MHELRSSEVTFKAGYNRKAAAKTMKTNNINFIFLQLFSNSSFSEGVNCNCLLIESYTRWDFFRKTLNNQLNVKSIEVQPCVALNIWKLKIQAA